MPAQSDDDVDFGSYLPDRTPKTDNRSKLLKAKERAAGLIVNACPFGCEDEDLDELTYCKHLVGFTLPGNPALFEAMKWRPTKDGGEPRFRFTDGKDVRPVLDGDKLVRISTCSRVYRDVDKVKIAAPAAAK